MRISDWSSDVCSSDLGRLVVVSGPEPVAATYWIVAPAPQWRQKKVKAIVAALTAPSDQASIKPTPTYPATPSTHPTPPSRFRPITRSTPPPTPPPPPSSPPSATLAPTTPLSRHPPSLRLPPRPPPLPPNPTPP